MVQRYGPFASFNLPRFRYADLEEINPVMDIFEDSNDIVLKAELPGIKKEDIEVTLTDSTIILSGGKKKETEAKKKHYYKWESSYGSFYRMFNLPTEIQPDKVKSSFKNGVLEIRVPKSEEAKKKEVKIKLSDGET